MASADPTIEVEIPDDLSGNMDPQLTKDGSKNSFSSILNVSRLPSLFELLRTCRQNIRPWSEFLSTSNFKTIPNVTRLSGRIVRNLKYFASNYVFVSLILVIYCLLTSPLILIALLGVFYLCYKIQQNAFPEVALFGRKLNTNQQCTAVSIAAIPVLYLCGAGSMIFWVIGASVFVIVLHAAFYNIDAVVTEEQETFLDEVV